jgi:hypothetical protein
VTCAKTVNGWGTSLTCVASQNNNRHVSRPHCHQSRPQQQQTGGKKGKKKVTEYKRRKATGHAPIEDKMRSRYHL